jgi:hypothetical protein
MVKMRVLRDMNLLLLVDNPLSRRYTKGLLVDNPLSRRYTKGLIWTFTLRVSYGL